MKTLPEDVNTMIGYKSTKLSTKFPVKCKTDFQYKNNVVFFFLSGFSFTDTGYSQDSKGREGTTFYSTLPLPLAHEH